MCCQVRLSLDSLVVRRLRHDMILIYKIIFGLTDMNFFKFWWDQDLDELKSRSVVSCDIWKAAGRPRSGPIFRNYRRDKSAYRYGIRSKRISDTEALMEKQGASSWKCWKIKFEKGGRSLNSVNGITDNSLIAEHFVSHFSKSCIAVMT